MKIFLGIAKVWDTDLIWYTYIAIFVNLFRSTTNAQQIIYKSWVTLSPHVVDEL